MALTKSRKIENRAGQTKSIKRDGIPADKIPPYDSNMSSVLKCTWRRRVMDINFDTSMHRHTISKAKEKKEGQRHHEESRFSRLSILSLIVLSMLSSLTLSRMSIISLPFSFRGIEGSKAIISSVVFKSSSPKSL